MKRIVCFLGGSVFFLIAVTAIVFFLHPRIPLGGLSGPLSTLLSSLTGNEQVISGQFYLVPGTWSTLLVDSGVFELTSEEGTHLKAKIHSAKTSLHLWSLFTGEIRLDGFRVNGMTLDILTAEENKKSDTPKKPISRFQAASLPLPLRQRGIVELTDISVTIRQKAVQSQIQFQLENAIGQFSSDATLSPDTFPIQHLSFDLTLKELLMAGKKIRDIRLSSTMEDGVVKNSPFAASFRNSAMSGHYSLNLTGEVPEISIHLDSSFLNIGAILEEQELAEGIILQLDKTTTDLETNGWTLAELVTNLIFTIHANGGSYEYKDPNTGTILPVILHKAKIHGVPGDKITVDVQGEIVNTPVSMSLEVEDRRGEPPTSINSVSFENHVLVAGTHLDLSGKIPLPYLGTGVTLACRLRGELLSSLHDLLNLNLPDIGPYNIQGSLSMLPEGYRLDALELQVGSSALSGNVFLNTIKIPPAITIDLQAHTIQLDDFREIWISTPDELDGEMERQKKRFLTDQTILDRYDASVSLIIKEVYSGEDYLGSGLLKIEQQQGSFRISPLQIQFPKGIVDVEFSLDPADHDRHYTLDVNIDDLDYGFVGRWFKLDSEMSGIINLRTSLESKSPDFQNIMRNGSGYVNFMVQPEKLQTGLIDIWAINLLSYLMSSLAPEDESQINCAAGRFMLNNGVLSGEELLIDTSRIQISGDLVVDFQKQWIKGRLKPRPKRPQFFSLATPIQINGELSDLGVGVATGDVFGTLIRLATAYIVVPIQWIVLNKLPEDGTADCLQIMEPQKQKEVPSGDEWYSSP